MAAPPNTTRTTVLQSFQVAPPADVPTQSLHLLHFDIILLCYPIQATLFYKLPNCSKSHFLEDIVPRLKNSLSHTLKHYLPLAGNIIIPPDAVPFARYATGDSVCVTVTEWSLSSDFHHLSSDLPRDADEIEALVPHLPPLTLSSDQTSNILLPASVVQITLFPNQGFCIGWANQHAICDGTSIVGFLHAWASVNNYSYSLIEQQTHDNDDHFLQLKGPFYDRTTALEAPHELDLQATYWNQLKNQMTLTIQPSPKYLNNLTKMFGATLVLTDANIQKLKNFARQRRPGGFAHLSSFTAVCSHLWVCLAKLAATMEEEVAEDEPEYFFFPANYRALMNPPLPPNYFGNYVAFVKAETNQATLKGDGGFLAAADIIGESIQQDKDLRIRDQNKVDVDTNRFIEVMKLRGKRVLVVAGSPRFDLYGIDFGWGRVKKYDHVSGGRFGCVSLCKSKDELNGGVEIGLNLTKLQADYFQAIFNEELVNGYNIL